MDERSQTEQILIVVQHPHGPGRDDEPTLKQDVIFDHADDERDEGREGARTATRERGRHSKA